MTVDFLFRYTTDEAFFSAMTALGVPNNPANRFEEQLGNCSHPPKQYNEGIVRMVRLWPEQVARIPDIILPPETVLIDWRSDELNEGYEPTYTEDRDIDGVLTVTSVLPGRIA